MSGEIRWSMPRWAEVGLTLVGAVSAIIGIVQFGMQMWGATSAPAAAPPKAVEAPASAGLEMIDASLQTARKRNHILGLIASGSDHFLTLDVAIANRTRRARSACTLIVDYGVQGGGHGTTVALAGEWQNWYEGGAQSSFALPAGPSTAQHFFIGPNSKPLRLAWAKVRVRCEAPENEVSRWANVDLSHADWPTS